jgi:hypothetical protein
MCLLPPACLVLAREEAEVSQSKAFASQTQEARKRGVISRMRKS